MIKMNIEDKLINYFLKLAPLSPAEQKAITDSMLVKRYKKDEYILKEGQSNRDTFLVLEGLVRQYKMSDNNDVTINFYSNEQWIISLSDFEESPIAQHNLLCMEDTVVVVGNEARAQGLFKQFPGFEKISRQIMETVFREQQNFMNTFLTDKPEQRYLKLLKSRPDIFQKVPQYHIATYIGVKPESLSRIRKKISSKKDV